MKVKKIISLFLTVALALTYCMSFGIVADATTTSTTFTVSSKQAYAGESVDVTVSIGNNPGNIGGLTLKVKAGNGLTLTNVVGDTLFSDVEMGDDYSQPEFVLNWLASGRNPLPSTNGVFVTLTYSVAADATGDIDVTASIADGDYFDHENYDDLPFSIVQGKVTVSCKNHNWSDWDEVTPATCESTGLKTRTCSVCGATDRQTIDKLQHNMAVTPAQSASCTTDGNKKYYTCSICHKNYADEAGTTVLNDVVVPKLGHDLKKVEKVDSTCQKTGTEAYWKCSRCQKMFSDADGKNEINAPAVIPMKQHVVTASARKEPSCTEDGHIAYYTCNNCGKVYEDEAGTKEITDLSAVTLPALGHDLVKTDKVDATCVKEGTQAYWTCTRCHKMFSDAQGKNEIEAPIVIPKAAHTLTKVNKVNATCETDGTEAYWKCSKCEKLFSDAQGNNEINAPRVIAKLGHDLVKTDEVPATCDKEGTEAYWKCSRCGKMFSDANGRNEINAPVVIPRTQHIVTASPRVEPTCTEAGHIATYKCNNCGRVYADREGTQEINPDTIAIPALGHDIVKVDEVAPNCGTKTNGTKEHYKCNRCQKLFSDADGKNEIEAPEEIAWAHDWGEVRFASDDDKPTCTQPGHGYKECNNCGEKEDVDFEALGHIWEDEPTYKSEEDKPTCTEPGHGVVVCTRCHEEVEVDVPALGHTWGEWFVTKPATTISEGEEKRICEVCEAEETRVVPKIVDYDRVKPTGTGGGSSSGITPSHQSDSTTTNNNSNNNNNTTNTDTSPTVNDIDEPDDEEVVDDESPFEEDVSGETEVADEDEDWIEYEVVEVNGDTDISDVVITKVSGLTVKIDAPAKKFVKALIDGKKLSDKYYSVESGSTIIKFFDIVLEYLDEGDHNITFVYKDGQAELNFEFAGMADDSDTIEPVYEGSDSGRKNDSTSGNITVTGSSDESNPLTGVAMNVSAFVVIGLAAGAGALALMRKKNHKK